MAYEDFCAACTYLGEREDCGKYWCSRKGQDIPANSAKCYSFCEAYSRSNYSRENMYRNSQSHSSSGCYLTTAMCQILGFDDNNYYLNTLRTFRNDVMQNDIKYIPLLVTYDIAGPIISKKLFEDKNGLEISKILFENYITKAVLAIEESKTNEAINIYTAMTKTLSEHYKVNTDLITPNIEEIDVKSLGHGNGYVKKLVKPILSK